jgi:NodT family efflux transporter outer membrane factor (OMF) lipoprotein
MTHGLRRVVIGWGGLSIAALACASACATAPAYQKPSTPAPVTWDTAENWRPAAPADRLPRGAWWTIFHDDALSGLEAQVIGANATIAGATARYEQARALASVAAAANYPVIDANASATQERPAGTTLKLGGTASYEVDLFGKRARNIDVARAAESGAADDLENVRLVLTADLAANYFTLRRLDREIDVVTQSLQVLERALVLIQARHDGGLVSGLDVAQQQTLIESTRTQSTLLKDQRASVEHAIAVLVGQPAPGFRVAPAPMPATMPAFDVTTPSDLLERRPDIASAERAIAAANARLGIARTAFFPTLTLFGSAGFKADSLLKILDVPSMVWAVGSSMAQGVFDGGARKAREQFAAAGYDAAVADYRAVTLRAFREVQDSLTTLAAVEQARTSQARAVAAAERAVAIVNSRYAGGLSNALDVVISQQSLLNAQRAAVQLDGARLIATVQLIKAMGGGFDN